MSAVVFIIVEGLLIYNVTHHFKRHEQQSEPPQPYRQYIIEGIYTGVPVLTVIAIFILMMNTMSAVAAPAPQSAT